MLLKRISFVILFTILMMVISGCDDASQSSLSGEFIGQNLPGEKAVMFAPGLVSTMHGEFASAFSPDGTEFLFGLSGAPQPVICVIKRTNERWIGPEVAFFSGRYLDVDANYSPDGKRIIFCSRRPDSENGPPNTHTDLWMVEKRDETWSEAHPLGAHINTSGNEYYPVFTSDGSLYFSSTRAGGYGGADIYRAQFMDGKYGEPQNLGPPINTENFEGDLFIAPDESYIIVTVYGRDDTHGSGDLYISFKKEDGSWDELTNLGPDINSNANEHCPMLSPDGKYFFFSSGRSKYASHSETPITYEEKIVILEQPGAGRNEDIYWMDSGFIQKMKNIKE